MEAENVEFTCTPPDIREAAQEAIQNLLPTKSKPLYDKEYAAFTAWCREKGALKATENVVLAYFQEKSRTKKSSTLWAQYSMLRACLNVYQDCDISKFPRLHAFLKRQSQGYQPKKSKILDITEINQFLTEADDLQYLATKVILIMGYNGACRCDEITKMSVDDVVYKVDTIHVKVPKTKTNVTRLFVITEAHWIRLIKKYVNLRPTGIATKRFFLTYRNGRCTTSPIGINTISQVPRTIARFLNLNDSDLYTGHCFRRSSASSLANNGADLITIKQHGAWKSPTIAEGYVETSLKRKTEVADMLRPSTSASTCVKPQSMSEPTAPISDTNETGFIRNIQRNTNFTQSIVTQNVPGITINAQENSNVVIKVFTNCKFLPNTD